MTTTEIKKEIGKALEQVPEKLLRDILALLQEVGSHSDSNPNLTSNLTKILSEDGELLKKLAQ